MTDQARQNESAVFLRSCGWVCIPPTVTAEEPPEPAPGQLWVSSSPSVLQRRVIHVEPQRWIGKVSYYRGREASVRYCRRDGWEKWAKDCDARPAL